MATELITLDQLHRAVELLKEGKIVAFPTETVYGLGAIANNQEAVQRVYDVKGRPSDNPLIVHVASKEVSQYIELPAYAQQLIEQFWPGPLTIIGKLKTDQFASSLHQGRETIALRMPDNATTLELIEQVGFPIVGPSANTSGKPSPTRAAHVLDDFFGKIEGVLYGENSTIGIESTVVDITDPDALVILRPGFITANELSEFPMRSLEPVEANQTVTPLSPGMKYKHYAPHQPVYLIDSQYPELWDKAIRYFHQQDDKVGILADDNLVACYEDVVYKAYSLGGVEDTVSAAKALYDGLRFFDKSDVDVVLAQAYEKANVGIALMNRLEKAAENKYFN